MKALIGILIATALAIGAGCAKTDWIDRTLVTVDVTGSWQLVEGFSTITTFDLKQHGSTVTEFIQSGTATTAANLTGPIGGTVAGDVFRFKSTRGDLEGELTVSGDEMAGTISRAGGMGGVSGPRAVSLRRADSSSPPVSPPR